MPSEVRIQRISDRIRDILESELAALGPVRASEVEEARADIVRSIRDLEVVCLDSDGREHTVLINGQTVTVQGEPLLLVAGRYSPEGLGVLERGEDVVGRHVPGQGRVRGVLLVHEKEHLVGPGLLLARLTTCRDAPETTPRCGVRHR